MLRHMRNDLRDPSAAAPANRQSLRRGVATTSRTLQSSNRISWSFAVASAVPNAPFQKDASAPRRQLHMTHRQAGERLRPRGAECPTAPKINNDQCARHRVRRGEARINQTPQAPMQVRIAGCCGFGPGRRDPFTSAARKHPAKPVRHRGGHDCGQLLQDALSRSAVSSRE